jgi:plastocyanin
LTTPTSPPSAAPTTTISSPAPSEPVTESEPEPNALGVAAEDQGGFRYTLSRQSVHAGKLTVQLNNRGEDPHDMDMQRVNEEGEPEGEIVEMPITKPGAQSNATVEVEAGTYRMWCTLGHHAMEGMEATIKVE